MILQSNDLARLLDLEQQAVDGVEAVKLGMDSVTLAIYEILNDKLYLAHKDERGLPLYKTQEEYIPVLARKVGLGRSTIFKYKGIADFALNTLELPVSDFISLGGKDTFERVKTLVGDSDASERKLEIIETLEELKDAGVEELDLSVGDKRKELQSKLAPDRPIITYYGEANYAGLFTRTDLHWFYEKGDEIRHGQIEINLPPDIPREVVDEIYRKLNIK